MTIVRSGEGRVLKVLDDTLRVLLPSSDSPHRMAVMMVEVPAGGFTPPHSHRDEEEGYLILEGELAMTLGSSERRLAPGDFAYVPPGMLHGYRNVGAGTVRFLAWTVGGPIDEFFAAMSEGVREMPRDAAVMAKLMQRYGVAPAGAG
jgi:quercetin dioxygenase-like cupin family protein